MKKKTAKQTPKKGQRRLASVSPMSARLRRLRARQKRAEDLFQEPGILEEIFDYVANGGSPIELAEKWRISYSSLILWIYADPARKEQYERALAARGEFWIQRVLQELETIAVTDLRQAFEADGSLKAMKDLPTSVARAIASVEVDELFEGRGKEREQVGFTKKLKFWDKTRALELVGKKLKMFVDQVEVKGTVSIAEEIKKARERAGVNDG